MGSLLSESGKEHSGRTSAVAAALPVVQAEVRDGLENYRKALQS